MGPELHKIDADDSLAERIASAIVKLALAMLVLCGVAVACIAMVQAVI